jgi:NAD(P)H-nitrite reductase large subunit
MHHIIIGAGPAGVTAAQTLRENAPEDQITLIGDEPEAPYSRMAIPYLLVGNIDEQGTHLRQAEDFFSGQRIEVRRERVASLNASGQSLKLHGGDELKYDRLLIATGSRPSRPPVPGMDLPGVLSCWTLDDARRIIDATHKGSRVVLIGAGFIGCIILEALQKRGVDLTVVETGDRMVPRMLNDKAGGLLKNWCQQQGVRVLTSTQVAAIDSTTDAFQVRLDSGDTLDADLVITATGVKPNTDFLSGSDVKVDQGVVVDKRLQSSDANIFAAGDVAQGFDFSTGYFSVQAIQPTATEHGRIAALNMLGADIKHHGCINMNVLDTLGLISCSFGAWMGVDGGDSAELYNPETFRYLSLQFEGDVLIGASSVGWTQHIGVLRGLIESRIHLGAWKERLLRDPGQLMEAYMASTQVIG